LGRAKGCRRARTEYISIEYHYEERLPLYLSLSSFFSSLFSQLPERFETRGVEQHVAQESRESRDSGILRIRCVSSGGRTLAQSRRAYRHTSIKINDKEGRARTITRQSEFRCSDQVNLSPREFPDSSPFYKTSRRHSDGSTIDRNLFMRPHQCGPFAAARNRPAAEGRERKRAKDGEGKVINEESVALAKNAKDSENRASLQPFRLAALFSSGRGQLFYWPRVAARALGSTVSVNRAKPPKSERRIIALVNLRVRDLSFFLSAFSFRPDVSSGRLVD